MLVNIREASNRTGIGYWRLRRWLLDAEVPMGRIGRVCLIRLEDVQEVVKAHQESKRAS